MHAHPSFGMAMTQDITQDIKDLFAVMRKQMTTSD